MPRNQVFIISWAGQHANACLIADALADANVDVYIVFSDPNPVLQLTTEATVIRRDDHLFAGDKLQACMEAFDGDHLFVICADCTCDDWVGAVKAGVTALADQEDVWIWAPHIHHSGYGLQRTAIMPLPHTGLTVVAHTDTIVFGWKKPVVERIRKSSLGDNLYGWGIGWMAIAFTYTQKKWAVVDPAVHVRHPASRNYPSASAAAQRDRYLLQLDAHETFFCRVLNGKMISNSQQPPRRKR